MSRITPRVGDGLYNNPREKLFTVTEDTTAGHHDMLIPACDAATYRQLGCEEYHQNCAENLVEGLECLGACFSSVFFVSVHCLRLCLMGEVESWLTLEQDQTTPIHANPSQYFMNVPIQEHRTTFKFEKAAVEKGQ